MQVRHVAWVQFTNMGIYTCAGRLWCKLSFSTKWDPWYTVGGNVNWWNHLGKQYGGSPRKLKIELHMIHRFCSWAYIQTKLQNHTSKRYMFTAALFTIAKPGGNLPIDRWMNKKDVVHIYSGILLCHQKPFITTLVDQEIPILREKWNWC